MRRCQSVSALPFFAKKACCYCYWYDYCHRHCYFSMSGMQCNAVSQPVPIDWLESWPLVTKECIVIYN